MSSLLAAVPWHGAPQELMGTHSFACLWGCSWSLLPGRQNYQGTFWRRKGFPVLNSNATLLKCRGSQPESKVDPRSSERLLGSIFLHSVASLVVLGPRTLGSIIFQKYTKCIFYLHYNLKINDQQKLKLKHGSSLFSLFKKNMKTTFFFSLQQKLDIDNFRRLSPWRTHTLILSSCIQEGSWLIPGRYQICQKRGSIL